MPVGPSWQVVTFGVNFDYYLRYSQEGLLPCIMDVVSRKQGNYVQGENGFMSVCHLSKVVIWRVAIALLVNSAGTWC